MDLGDGPTAVVSNPWRADLVSAHASTGASEVLTYATFPLAARLMMGAPRLMASAFGRFIVARAIASAPAGPTDAELAEGSTRVLALAESDGRRAEVRVRGPEAYVFTARAAAECARRVLSGVVRPGFATPSVLGLDLLTAMEGVVVS
jgi:saccharopine dehydrogenase (NAD+, L-lysine-forming)